MDLQKDLDFLKAATEVIKPMAERGNKNAAFAIWKIKEEIPGLLTEGRDNNIDLPARTGGIYEYMRPIELLKWHSRRQFESAKKFTDVQKRENRQVDMVLLFASCVAPQLRRAMNSEIGGGPT